MTTDQPRSDSYTLPPKDHPLYAGSSAWVDRSFALKDVYTDGVDALLDRSVVPVHDSLTIVQGYNILDDAFNPETGKPDRDAFIWNGLAFQMLNASDLVTSAVFATLRRASDWPEWVGEWEFALQFPDRSVSDRGTPYGTHTFLRIYPTTASAVDCVPEGDYRSMGAIERNAYGTKIGAYPLQCHPNLAKRSTASIHYVVAEFLARTGMLIDAHWMPVDTSKGFARYHLTDGIEHYIIDFSAPMLVKALSMVDMWCGRDDEDGAITCDDLDPDFCEFYSLTESTSEPFSEDTGDAEEPPF